MIILEHGEKIPYLVDTSVNTVHITFNMTQQCRDTINRRTILRLEPNTDLAPYVLCPVCFV